MPPFKFADDSGKMLLLDSILSADKYLEYAIKHNMSVKFTACYSTNSIEKIYSFVEKGFKLEFQKEAQYAYGLEFDSKVIVYLINPAYDSE